MARGVPVECCTAVELRLGVGRRDLRPDDWRDIWPELAESEQKQPVAPANAARVAIKKEASQPAQGGV